MSEASMFFADLANRNVTLRLDGDVVVPRGLRDALTTHVLAELRQLKPEIVAALRAQSVQPGRLPGQAIGRIPEHDLGAQIADIAEAWRERVAIVMEAGDIDEDDAHRIADAQIGRQFVEVFMPGEWVSEIGLPPASLQAPAMFSGEEQIAWAMVAGTGGDKS